MGSKFKAREYSNIEYGPKIMIHSDGLLTVATSFQSPCGIRLISLQIMFIYKNCSKSTISPSSPELNNLETSKALEKGLFVIKDICMSNPLFKRCVSDIWVIEEILR